MLKVIAAVADSSMAKLNATSELQQTTLMTLVALLAAMPAIAKASPDHVAFAIAAITEGRADAEALRKRAANLAAYVMNMAAG